MHMGLTRAHISGVKGKPKWRVILSEGKIFTFQCLYR